jgi:hypothetical protein
MSHIIQKFGDWKRLNEEDETPGREKQKGKRGNKIVYIPVDRQTLKLKITNETDIIDADGYLRVTPEGVHAFDELLRLIKGQAEIIDYYGKNGGGLNDLRNNIVVYDIDVDRGERKQVITFKILSKNDLTSGDTSKKINSSVRYVRSDQLRRAMEGALINVDKTNPITSDQNVKSKFKLPFSAASIVGSTDANLIDFMDTAYNTIREDDRIKVSKIMPRLKAELQANKLGVASQLFIKALNSSLMTTKGIGLSDNRFKEDIEDDITQTLYDFIMNAKKALGESKSLYLGLDGKRIFEAESDKIRGLDTDAFLAVANTIVPETGDIKVPDGGFKEGMTANTDFAKFQLLLYKYFKKSLGKWQVYINFAAKKTGDGNGGTPTGNYGKTTSALVSTIKTYLEKPRWEDSNGAQIDATFVKRIQDEIKQGSITESSSTRYLGLDGNTIINEDFGAPASDPAAKPVVKSTAKPQVKTQTKASTTNSAGVVGPLPSDTNKAWRYKVVKGQWHGIDTSDKSDTYGLIRNPKYIAALMAAFPNQGGHYLRMKKVNGAWSGMDKSAEVIGYTRKNNKWYISPVGGGSTEVPVGSQVAIDLDREYINTKYVSGTSSSGVVTPAMIDNEIVKLGNEIKQFVENGANFKAYSGGFWSGGDNEQAAWDNILLPRWKSTWKPTLNSIRTKVKASTMINSTDKGRYEESLRNIEGMFGDPDLIAMRPFKNKFLGGMATDSFKIVLLLSVNGKNSDKITIDTDFEYEE